jgi:hypothetical protein
MYEPIIETCRMMDTFGLPRAVGNIDTDRFIFGNSSFLRITGMKEGEGSGLALSELVRIQVDSSNPARMGQLIPLTAESRDQGFIIHGHAAIRPDGLVYLMIPLFGDPSPDFELGRSVGKEQERQRFRHYVHEQLTPELLSVVSSIESLRARFQNENKAAEGTLKEIGQSLSNFLDVLKEKF